MKTKDLKNKILDLAMRGKLVPQDPSDEPASVLLEQIEEEKKKLIKEKKIRRPKKLPPISKEEIPFDIPDSWEWVRLAEVGDIYNGNSINAKVKKEKYTNKEDGYDYIATKDVGYGNNINYNTGVKIPIGEPKFKVAKKNSVLICSEGGSAGKKVGLLNKDVCFGNKLISTNPYSKINPRYLFYYLLSEEFYYLFAKKMTGIIGGISMTNFSHLPFPLPPFEEQKQIVGKLDELFALIDELDKNKEDLLNNIEAVKEKVLQLAVEGKLVSQDPSDEPASELLKKITYEREKLIKEKKIRKQKPLPEITDDEKPFDIPDSWEWVRLGEVTIINPRNSFEDNEEASFVPMPLIDEGFGNKHTSEVRLWKKIKSGYTHFAENDVAVAKITPCFENRKSVIMRNLVNGIGAGTTELHIIRSINQLILPEYILNICKTDRFIKEGVNTYTGTAGQQRIGREYIMSFVIPLPPLNEQKKIVKKVDTLMKILEQLGDEIKNNDEIL